jgi:cell wall assembly regulator SMI1
MKRLFDRIHVWLAANAPDTLTAFAPGATEDAIRAAEQELGVRLPDDVREAYRIHDGCFANFLHSEEWCSLEGMLSGRGMLKELLDGGAFAPNRGRPHGPIRAKWYHPSWLPISNSGFGYYFCLDMAPTSRGVVGQVIRFCHDEEGRYLQAKGFREWVARFVAGLEAGRYHYDERFGRWVN